jgi:hypothetical protein
MHPGVEAGRDPESELRRLRFTVDELRDQQRALFAAIASLPVLLLVAFSLFGSAYGQVDENEEALEDAESLSLGDLPGQASDFDNGTVQLFAVLLILALVALAITALVLLVTRRTLAPAIAAGVTIVLTLALQVVVGASGGDGAIHELGVTAAAGAWWPLAAGAWCAFGCWLVQRTR